MNQKHSAWTKSFIPWDWTVSSTYSDLTAFSTSSVLCFHHLTTFMLRTFVSFETVEKFSLILTFIAWVLLCFYFLLFFFYLINILLRDSSSRVSYTICWISDSLSLSIVSSISSLASTFQDVIHYSSASVFQPMIRIIIGIISIDHRNFLLLCVELVCAFSSRFNILHYIHIHHMGIVWLLFVPYYPQ